MTVRLPAVVKIHWMYFKKTVSTVYKNHYVVAVKNDETATKIMIDNVELLLSEKNSKMWTYLYSIVLFFQSSRQQDRWINDTWNSWVKVRTLYFPKWPWTTFLPGSFFLSNRSRASFLILLLPRNSFPVCCNIKICSLFITGCTSLVHEFSWMGNNLPTCKNSNFKFEHKLNRAVTSPG